MVINRICGIIHFKMDNPNTEYIMGDYTLTSSNEGIYNYFSDDIFKSLIGRYALNNLVLNPCYIASANFEDNENYYTLSDRGLNQIHELILFLWFIKDNSCNTITHYTYIPEKDNTVYCLDRLTNYSNFQATFSDTVFTESDVIKATEILNASHALSSSAKLISMEEIYKSYNPKPMGAMNTGVLNSIKYSFRNRVERAILFLGTVRSSPFIPLKIALSMNILECLFSTDSASGEIVHKIAERVAIYIGENKTERLALFKFVKSSYTLRSKYFHGQKLDSKYYSDIKLNEMAIATDNLLRRILTKVILVDSIIFTSKEETLNEWFNDLIFN